MIELDDYGKVVSFEVYPASILGDRYTKVKILSILDYDTARLFADVNSLAVSVYPFLPAGTPKDYTKYKYVKLQHADGSNSVLAMEWINMRTLQEHTSVNLVVNIEASGMDTLERLRSCLTANNFIVKSIEVE